MTTLLLLDSCELEDATPAAAAIAPPIDTAEKRLQAWAAVCASAINVLTVGDVCYTWDAHPRRLKNGALEGRVYAQHRGEAPRDIGGYKIGADGAVLKLPAALTGVLPGELATDEQWEPGAPGEPPAS